MQVLFDEIPINLEERLNSLVQVEQNHSNFARLIDGRIVWLLELDKQVRNTSYITFATCDAVRNEMEEKLEAIQVRNSEKLEIEDLFARWVIFFNKQI